MTDKPEAGMLEVGRIGKAHGIRGEVLVTLVTNIEARLDAGSVVHTSDGSLTVERSRAHQGKHIVKFEEIRDRNAAETLRGLLLSAPPMDDDEVLWVHDLIGSLVVTVDGRRVGVVDAVQDNPASDLLVIGDAVLVPLTFFVEMRDASDTESDAGAARVVVIDPPPGLIDDDHLVARDSGAQGSGARDSGAQGSDD